MGDAAALLLEPLTGEAAVLPFWQRMGFTTTGERKPYRYGAIESEVIVMRTAIVR